MKRNIITTTTRTALILGAIIALGGGNGIAQESTSDLVKRLRGQAGATPEAGEAGSATTSSKLKTRGISTRGISTRGISTRGISPATTPQVKTETRSVLFSTRGIPKAIQSAAEEDKIKVTTTTATKSTGAGDYSVAAGSKAVEVKYDVDPESKVTKDNILFQKGNAHFADQNSYNVVVELATALKDPSLANLKYVVEGHASAEGSAYANQNLSQERAEQIVHVLNTLGVSRDRLLPVGFGETQARYPAGSQEILLRQDRRVVIFRLDY